VEVGDGLHVGEDARGDHHRQHVHSYQQHRAHRESDEQALGNQSIKTISVSDPEDP